MANVPNTSFIPKRGPTRSNRGTRTRQIHAFTVLSYILLFATLVAVGGVFLYDRYVTQQLQLEVEALSSEISSFSEADMQRVQDFDKRLRQAQSRVDVSVSIVSIFEALERSTINSVQILDLSVDREEDEQYVLAAAIKTDSFDSSIFQRGVLQRESAITASSITELDVHEATSENNSPTEVTFTAKIGIPLNSIPYIPDEAVLEVTEDVAVDALPEVVDELEVSNSDSL